jgi:hypothetical protein
VRARVRACAEGAPDSLQDLSGAPPDSPEAPPVRAPTVRTQRPVDVAGAPDCPVRHATDNLPTATFGGWGYKYPNHPTIHSIQVFQLHTPYKSRSKKVCYKCGKPGHFIAKCPLSSDSDRDNDKKGKKREKKRYHKKRGGDAHVCRECDSDESSTDSSNEDAANIAVTKGLLFPNVGHKCLMAKDGKRKKVKSKSSTKYETSSDEDNSCDEEDNLRTLFANLNMQQKEKLNELISAIHEKDELLDSQEDFLIKENKKHVKVKNAYALEVEKCEKLSSELSTCHDIIANLRNENAKIIVKVDSNVCDVSIPNFRDDNVNLLAKIEELNVSLASLKIENENLIAKAKDLDVCNVTISNRRSESDILHAKIVELKSCKLSTSSVEHVSICTRCRDINVDAIHDHLALIKKQNDHIAQLNAKINEHDLENEKFKFARSMLYRGRRPGSRMALASERETMSNLMPLLKDCLTLLRARLTCLRITRVTFCTLPVIPSTRLGEFTLGSLTLALIMLLCIRVRHLALGNQPVQNCLRKKLLLHQMILTFHLKLLMHLMF